MPKKKDESGAMMAQVGSYSFLVGVLLSVVAAFTGFDPSLTLVVLGVLGLVVGFLNITEAETVPFLVSTIAIMSAAGALAAALQSILRILPIGVADGVGALLAYIVAFVAPAAGLVALKTIWELSKSQ
jgi:hypothetical protein